ncbi:MAG: PspC domain-containing protein [Bacteroidales bacterium]|nr:PspC domain-containing protein [Bacteroidales bacterium]
MKKTLTVNLSGVVFNIDEDAYDMLSDYMCDLERHFAKTDEKEVLRDIECRIAELFNEKMPASHNVVNIDMVREVISIMGRPDQMDDGESSERNGSSDQFMNDMADTVKAAASEAQKKLQKKLYRRTDQVVIAGVCSGLATWAGVNVVVVRVLALVATLCLAQLWVPVVYLILWMLVPQATSASQKLEMEGEAVNVDSICDMKEREADDDKGEQSGGGCLGAFLKVALILIGVIVGLAVFGTLFGVIFGFLGMVIGAVTSLFAGTVSLTAELAGCGSAFVPSLLALVVVVVPVVAIVLLVKRLLSPNNGKHVRNVLLALLFIWVLALVFLGHYGGFPFVTGLPW